MTAIHIGLTPSQREGVAQLLKALLADEAVLQAKTRNFHWNVTGMHFSELHAFFESQYNQLDEWIDDIAERVRQLGFSAPGSLADFLEHTRLKESSTELKEKEMLLSLLQDHESLISQLRSDVETTTQVGDAGNSDFLTSLLEGHEKMAWMLRSYLS